MQAQRTINSYPAPIGGWNVIDSIDNMPATDAITMENWIPRENYVEIRTGTISRITLAECKTLMSYNYGGTKTLLGAGSGNIYSLNPITGVSTILNNGYSNNEWQHTTYKGRIFGCNGVDAPFDYNGTVVADTAWTGPADITKLVNVELYKNTLFFIEKDTLKFWYATAGNITGALTGFDLNQFSQLGGSLLAIATWTQDGGTGQDDQILFITTEGEVFVYAGSDPSSATTWALRGIYSIPRPISYRCVEKLGGDVIVTTREGYYPMSRLLSGYISNQPAAFSYKINGAIRDLSSAQFDSFNWKTTYYKPESLLIVNVPSENTSQSTQHVMNTITGSWCKFTGLNANDWVLHGDVLYYAGIAGDIYEYNVGTDDNGSDIQTDVQQAYNDYGSVYAKSFKMAMPILQSNFEFNLTFNFGVDYGVRRDFYSIASVLFAGTEWDEGLWDESYWGAATETKIYEVPLSADTGYKGSIGLKTSTSSGLTRWIGTKISTINSISNP